MPWKCCYIKLLRSDLLVRWHYDFNNIKIYPFICSYSYHILRYHMGTSFLADRLDTNDI